MARSQIDVKIEGRDVLPGISYIDVLPGIRLAMCRRSSQALSTAPQPWCPSRCLLSATAQLFEEKFTDPGTTTLIPSPAVAILRQKKTSARLPLGMPLRSSQCVLLFRCGFWIDVQIIFIWNASKIVPISRRSNTQAHQGHLYSSGKAMQWWSIWTKVLVRVSQCCWSREKAFAIPWLKNSVHLCGPWKNKYLNLSLK